MKAENALTLSLIPAASTSILHSFLHHSRGTSARHQMATSGGGDTYIHTTVAHSHISGHPRDAGKIDNKVEVGPGSGISKISSDQQWIDKLIFTDSLLYLFGRF